MTAERIIEIIIYVISSLKNSKVISDDNIRELEMLGYTRSEISTAFSWLAEKVETVRVEDKGMPFFKTNGFRILHDFEKDLFTKEAYSELLQYMSLGLLNNEQLEVLLHKAAIANFTSVDSKLLKHFITSIHFDHLENNTFASRMMLNGNDVIN